jgi:Transmembrane domain of unknown function (DUF3566)
VVRPKAVLETETATPAKTRAERERERALARKNGAKARTNGSGTGLLQNLARKRQQRTKLRPVAVRRPMERRYRQTVRSVDLWTVLKISVCFYLCGLIVTMASGVVLWWIASGLGVIHNVERFIGDLLGSDNFQFLSWRILRGAMLIGLVIVCLQVVCTVLAAAFYNLFAELLGGIEITVVEEEPPG